MSDAKKQLLHDAKEAHALRAKLEAAGEIEKRPPWGLIAAGVGGVIAIGIIAVVATRPKKRGK